MREYMKLEKYIDKDALALVTSDYVFLLCPYYLFPNIKIILNLVKVRKKI